MRMNLPFLRIYLYLVIFLALVGITDAVLTVLSVNLLLYVRVIPLLLFLFFFVNILSIAIFRRHHLPRRMYVLPIYLVTSYIIFLCLGIGLAVTGFNPVWLSPVLISIQAASSLFELGFSVYLLRKLDFSPVP